MYTLGLPDAHFRLQNAIENIGGLLCDTGAHLAIEEGRGCMFQKGPFRAFGVVPRKGFEN